MCGLKHLCALTYPCLQLSDPAGPGLAWCECRHCGKCPIGWFQTDEKCGVYSVYPQKTGIWLDLTYETGGINTYIYIHMFVCFQQILGGHLKVTARAVMELLSCWFKIVGGWSWPRSLIPIEYSRVLPVFSDVRSSLQLFELSEVRFFLMFVTVKQTILDSTGCCPFTTRLSGRTC